MKQKNLTLGFWVKTTLASLLLFGACKKLNAQQPACTTFVSVNNFVPIVCTTAVKYQFHYDNPTGTMASVKIRLKNTSGFCDSVCMTLPANSSGTLITPCLQSCTVFDTLKVSTYPIEGCTCPTALPVQFLFFEASKKDDGKVRLTWKVAVENLHPNAQFRVERSYDGTNFSMVALVFIDPTWNTYEFLDAPNSQKKVFYRIFVTEENKYSDIRVVSFDKGTSITHFINGETLYLNNVPPGAKVQMNIYDMTGRLIVSSQSKNISVEKLQKVTIYAIKAQVGNETYQAKVVRL